MIAELFSMLSNIDVSNVAGKTRLSVNLNRNRIRSISAFSSNSIFYFKTIVSDQVTPEEVGMVSRMLEKSYASFVVACIGLMPFHRVKADDQAAIESYLQQFHQNLGISSGSGRGMQNMLRLASSISESVSDEDLKATQDFLLECWEKSRKNCSRYVNTVRDHLMSVNEMYSVDPIDPVTRVFQESYLKRLDELDSWGFIGEATANMLDNFDELDLLTDADIIKSMQDGSGDDDDDDLEDEYEDLDELLDESALNEGNVKGAINSVIFSLESVSENKIKSCSSLGKLRQLEAKLNKLKNKYAKYLDRYKRKYKENQSKKTKSKLVIRFNGETISNPKAFMKQYGGYIKIINKRLKMVEKRREELRKKKGLPADGGGAADTTFEESAIGTLTDLDLQVVDHLIEMADTQLNAPDSQAFIILEYTKYVKPRTGKPSSGQRMPTPRSNTQYVDDLGARDPKLTHNSAQDTVDTVVKLQQEINGLNAKNNQHVIEAKSRDQMVGDMRKQYDAMEKEFGRKNAEQLARLGIFASTQRELQAKVAELTKENERLKGTEPNTDDDLQVGDTLIDVDWKKAKPAGGINLGKVAANGQTNFRTFDDKIFTDMDMKKANEAVPTFAKATIGFVIDETEQVVNRDVLVGIKVHIDRVPANELINDIYNCIINKRQFLKFVKWISGEEKSLADLLFCFKELKADALNTRSKAGRWTSAFRRRKRWKDVAVPYLMKNYTPNGTLVLTMNEVEFIKSEFGVDIMRPDHVKMLMDSSFLLGFVILDQANEMVYVSYDGENGDLQQYTYAMAERDSMGSSDRALRELYRSFARQ